MELCDLDVLLGEAFAGAARDAADAAGSLILDQVSAGVAVRMSVLYQLLGGAE